MGEEGKNTTTWAGRKIKVESSMSWLISSVSLAATHHPATASLPAAAESESEKLQREREHRAEAESSECTLRKVEVARVKRGVKSKRTAFQAHSAII
jgi:hypothetical protein